MDQRKTEAQNQLQALKQECSITTDLLDKLLQMCTNHVNEIDKLDAKSFRMYSKYFISVRQFQSVSIQKIMEWNIDLEEFLNEKRPADVDHFRLLNNNSTCRSSLISLCESENISLSPTYTLHEPFSTIKTETMCSISKADNVNINPKQIFEETNIYISDKINNKKTDVAPLENEPKKLLIPDDINQCRKIVTETSSSSMSDDQQTIVDSEDFQMPSNFLSDSSSEYFCSASSFNGDKNSVEANLDDSSSYIEFPQEEMPKEQPPFYTEFPPLEIPKEQPPFYAEFPPLEIPKQKPKQPVSSSISESLKSLPVISLQERFLKSLPRTSMPDLTLRPASEHSRQSEASKQDTKSFDKPATLTLENINKILGVDKSGTNSKVNKKTEVKVFNEFKNSIDSEGIKHREAPKVGDTCMIGYVESPSEIYIQVADENSNSLDLISMQLSEIYQNTSFIFNSKTDTIKKLGDFYGINSGSTWFRVEVIDWMLENKEDNVMVQMIDYGDKYVVDYKTLWPLQHLLKILPRMAQLCHLGYLYPPGSTKSRRLTTWPEQVNNGFFEVLGDLNTQIFKIAHVYYCKQKRSYEVDLIKIDEKYEENTIGQILIDQGLAVEIIDNSEILSTTMKNQVRRAQGLHGITSDMSLDDVLETFFEQNIGEEAATINEALIHYDPRDEAETCKNLRRDGTCYKGKACKFRHVPFRKNGVTRDQEPVYDRAFEEDPLPCIDNEVFMAITHVIDIQCFYAQIRPDHLPGYPRPTINNLIKTMNNPNMIKGYKKLRLPPAPGQMVIAKHWNGSWYRAQVRDVLIPEDGNGIVEVYIVDFGDTLEVPISDLREITSEFLFMSFQAIECRLFNVRHKDGLDPVDARRHFEEQYLGQTFKAKIMGVPGHLEVLLENDRGEDIGLQIIEDGYGELNTEHFFPAHDERILID